MRFTIPVLTPGDAKFLFKYFAGIDDALSKRFSLGFNPDEEHLTSLLCELLDTNGAKLHSLPYSTEQLNDDFTKNGSLLRASISLKASPYNKYQERHHTQSDLGIKVEYKDYIDTSASFEKGVLFQAKKLFPVSSGKYTLSSQYTSFDSDQHRRIDELIKYYREKLRDESDEMEKKRHMMKECDDFFRYLLYNPPFTMLATHDKEILIHRQLTRDNSQIFDYLEGLHLYEVLSNARDSTKIVDSSSLVVRANDVHSIAKTSAKTKKSKNDVAPFNLGSVVEQVDIRKESFPWFIVFQLIMGDSGCNMPELIDLVEGAYTGMAREIGVAPPRYILKIILTAGTNPNQCEEKS